MLVHFRKYLIAGLLVWFPLWITILTLHFLISLMDETLKLIPAAYQPDVLLGFHIPGLGLVFTVCIVLFTGLLVTNFVGRYFIRLWDGLVNKIPLVRSIYMGVKKTVETLLTSKGQAFRKVLLVQYPREGLWSIAFLTGQNCKAVEMHTGEEMISVFIPTTPNPTSGFLLLVPKKDVRELDIRDRKSVV